MKKVKSIFSYLMEHHLFSRFFAFLFGAFLSGLTYNLFILPNSFNTGGTGGIALLVHYLFGVDPSLTILIIGLFFLFISYFTLGKKQTCRSAFGALLYPVFVKYTAPLATLLVSYIQFDNFIILLGVTGIVNGVASGLIYRAGFTCSGTDILQKILVKYNHITQGTASRIINTLIVIVGGFILGVPSIIYSIFIIVITSYFVDRILIGISSSKMFFVYSKKSEEIKKYALDVLHTGATIFDSEGGFMRKKRKILMVVVSTADYYAFRTAVLDIDPDAFFVISDCYEVNGGYKRETLPF